jgi:hypothetical protein
MYSDKYTKIELNETIIKVARLSPLTVSKETFKLIRVLTPSLGSLGDAALSQDRSLVLASAFSMLSQNTTEEHFEHLQQVLLGSILDNDNEPLEDVGAINSWLESHQDLNLYDLLFELFTLHLWQPISRSTVITSQKATLQRIKGVFTGMFPAPEDATVEGVEEGADVEIVDIEVHTSDQDKDD